MRSLLQCVFILVVAVAQPTRSQDTRKPTGNRSDPTLHRLHDILREQAGATDARRHDAYLALIELGNEETLPLLLERLRLDYGTSEPVALSGMKLGFICTQVHLVDAIRSITNTDQGMFYPRWAKWWGANRRFARLKWILDGFTEDGLQATDPPDERFGLELIDVLASNRQYYAINARRLLERVRPEERAAWLVDAAASDQSSRRLGVLRVLEQIDTAGHWDLIGKLTDDTDKEVRELAIRLREHRHVAQ